MTEIQVRYIKQLVLNEGTDYEQDAEFTIGKEYTWFSDFDTDGCIVNDKGDDHFMPSPLDDRDPHDEWATSDYFEVVSE